MRNSSFATEQLLLKAWVSRIKVTVIFVHVSRKYELFLPFVVTFSFKNFYFNTSRLTVLF